MPNDLKVSQPKNVQPQEQENKIPKEFEFLSDPKVKEQLAKVHSEGEYNDDEVRLMMAAQAVGDQIGQENLSDEVMKSLAEYMKQLGLITEIPSMKGKPEVGKPEGDKEGEAPKEQIEQAPGEEQSGAPQEEETPIEENQETHAEQNQEVPSEDEGQEEEAPQEETYDENQEEQPQENDREEIVIRRAMRIIETLLRGE